MSMRREQILELLRLIGSEQEQLAYERDVPIANVTDELVCMWFDDLNPAGSSADFTAAEQAILAQFDDFYRENWRLLPDSQGTVQTWLDSPEWRQIMQQARQAVEALHG